MGGERLDGAPYDLRSRQASVQGGAREHHDVA